MVGLVGALAQEAPDQAYGLAWITNDHRSTTGHFELARAEAAALLDGDVVPLPSLARLLAHTAGTERERGQPRARGVTARSRRGDPRRRSANQDRWGTVSVTGGKTTIALYRRDRELAPRRGPPHRGRDGELERPVDSSRRAVVAVDAAQRARRGRRDRARHRSGRPLATRRATTWRSSARSAPRLSTRSVPATTSARRPTSRRRCTCLRSCASTSTSPSRSSSRRAWRTDSGWPHVAVPLHGAADVMLDRISFTLDARRPAAERRDARVARGATWVTTRYARLEAEGRALPIDRAVEMADSVFNQVAITS